MDARARQDLNERLRRLADGDRSAFEPAYASLWPIVRAFCQRLIGGAEVEDVAQTALLKVFERASTFDGRRDALTWVLAITAWECRSARRRRSRSREVKDDDAVARAAVDRSSPEEELLDAELTAALRGAVGTLSDADRDTLERTIAEEAPRGATFRKRRERAMARLKEVWRKVDGDG